MISNTGYDTIPSGDTVLVSYQIDGSPTVTEAAVTNIAVPPFGEYNYEFTTTPDMSNEGVYHIKLWTTYLTDTDPANDTLAYEITHIHYVQHFPYVERFENGDGGWEPEGEHSTWAYGTPNGTVIKGASSGSNAWGTGNLQGGYDPQEASFIVSPCYDFSHLTLPQIAFDLWYETANGGDGAILQYSTDNGENWTTIGDIDDNVGWYNYTVFAKPDGENKGWTGSSNGWVNVKHILYGLGGESKVRFRLLFATAGASTNRPDGIAFDNVTIGETPVIPLPSSITDCGFVLLDAGADAEKISWSTGEATRIVLVKGDSQGLTQEYRVYVEDSVGLYNMDTTLVTLAPGPYVNLGPDTVVCGINNLQLNPTISPGATILWDNNSSSATRVINNSGTYWIQADDYGCTKRDSIEISFSESPIALFNNEQEANGQVVLFSDSSKWASTYYWDFGDGSSSILQNPQHFYQDAGTYTSTLIVTNACGADTLTKQVIVESRGGSGLNTIKVAWLRIYPNPSTGNFTLEVYADGYTNAIAQTWNIYGELILTRQLVLNQGLNKIRYDCTGLPNEPGFLEQFFGLGQIVRQSFQILAVADGRGIWNLGGRRGMAAHDLLNDFIFVDGHVHGLAHPYVRHGRPGFVAQGQEDAPAGRAADHLDLGIGRHLVVEFHRDTGDQVHLARKQSGKAGGRFGDRADFHLFDGGCAFPVVFVGFHLHVRSLDPFHELVSTGPVGTDGDISGIAGFRVFLVHDEDLMHVVGKPGNRILGLDHHGVIIDDVDFVDGFTGVDELRDVRVAQPFECELDVLGREGIAVVKFYALAQPEFPAQCVQPFPALGQRRCESSLRPFALQQTVEKIGEILQAGIGVVSLRVHHAGRIVLGRHKGGFRHSR